MNEMRMFQTVDGRTLNIRPVSQYLLQKTHLAIEERLRGAGTLSPRPTYSVTTASGAVETYPHDATTLQTDEDKAAWAAYEAGQLAFQREKAASATRLYLTRGLMIGDPPQEWIADMAALGIALPENVADRRYEYILMDVLPTPEDLIRAMAALTRLSMAGSPQEDIDAVEASFRRSLERHAVKPDPAA